MVEFNLATSQQSRLHLILCKQEGMLLVRLINKTIKVNHRKSQAQVIKKGIKDLQLQLSKLHILETQRLIHLVPCNNMLQQII
jgi:hypothetical protein